jgi:hypothetical protein
MDENVFKCQLKEPERSDYGPAADTDEKWAALLPRLKATFPGGVCDWSKPSVEYAPLGAKAYAPQPEPAGFFQFLPLPDQYLGVDSDAPYLR